MLFILIAFFYRVFENRKQKTVCVCVLQIITWQVITHRDAFDYFIILFFIMLMKKKKFLLTKKEKLIWKIIILKENRTQTLKFKYVNWRLKKIEALEIYHITHYFHCFPNKIEMFWNLDFCVRSKKKKIREFEMKIKKKKLISFHKLYDHFAY